jgi:hypothetical protein
MFPGLPRSRTECRVYTVANADTRIALKGDDPDFILFEAINTNFSGAIVTLPQSARIGKTFTLLLIANPQINPALVLHSLTVQVPANRNDKSPQTGYRPLTMYAGQEFRFLYTPNGWLTPRGNSNGSDGDNSAYTLAMGAGANGANLGVALGYNASAYTSGVAVGGATDGSSNGVGIGDAANGSSSGVAVGSSANGASSGVAIGANANTNGMDIAVALGRRSKAQRYRELVKSADGLSTCLRSFSILDWYGDTTNATPAELLLGGTASQYALLLNSSAFIFKLLTVARDNVNNVCAMWELTGGIKRGANAAATAIVGTVTKTVIAADAAATTGLWDIGATADTTSGSLKLTVTGEAAKTIRWNVRGDISELRF